MMTPAQRRTKLFQLVEDVIAERTKSESQHESCFGTREEILAQFEKLNNLENTSYLPLLEIGGIFLMPDGKFCRHSNSHENMFEKITRKKEYYPNGDFRVVTPQQIMEIFTITGIIRINRENHPDSHNRLDISIFTKVTPQQIKTIYQTVKDDPTIWLTWQIGDNNHQLVSGEGYRELLADLRKYGCVGN